MKPNLKFAMKNLSKLTICTAFAIYAYVSKLIFDKVYLSTKTVIDEAFHLPQGLAYCNYNFDTWDQKITTLPGLYLISAAILGPLGLCDIYWLRFVNYLAALLNLILFYVWFSILEGSIPTKKKLLSSLNLSLLPPLYFFSNLYYTDIVSLSAVLLLLIFNKMERHFFASVSGLMSVVIRQTNIIWVLMVFGEYFLKHYCYSCLKISYNRASQKTTHHWKTDHLKISENDVTAISTKHLKSFLHLQNLSMEVWMNLFSYCTIFVAFVVFLIGNGGIVIGDKTAHTAVIHISQLFYFSLFCIMFSWTHFMHLIIPFVRSAVNNVLLTVILIIAMILTVYFNTLVHPYLLADNRHYTFYIWTRFYQAIPAFRYIIIGAYLFGFYCLLRFVYSKQDISFAAVYLPCTILILILQKMIEVRYFLVPFILFRLRLKTLSVKLLTVELVFYCLVNFVTLNLFFNKDIYWVDFDYAQKLIW